MVDYSKKTRYNYDDLLEIMKLLRSENGCPWDREQNHESIRNNFIEETYEAVEAIDNGDLGLLREELGDVLLQVVFHARIEEEAGNFDIEDVVDGICKKLVVRHPHIFGDVNVSGSDEVLVNWDKIKLETKGIKSQTQSMVEVAKSLPSLVRAQKIQQKAAKVGFDWKSIDGALDKIDEEAMELRHAVGTEKATEELGDLLFAAVNAARFIGADAEESLYRANEKFVSRFRYVEESAAAAGKSLTSMSLLEMDRLWDEKKRIDAREAGLEEEKCKGERI